MSTAIPGFSDFTEKFLGVINSQQWQKAQNDFNKSTTVLCVGNGGNLAVCDHGAIDISRLTNKQATAPGSGILASSLINDVSHDLWVKNWLSITLRGLPKSHIKNMMIIGVSSSGYSKNICSALDHAMSEGMSALLISANEPKIAGDYNTVLLDVDEYHSSEVLTLTLFYQLIHGAGFACPTISDSNTREIMTDYSFS
jgi:D-sedoheptulose 7-phosphate isomerase